MSDSAPSKQSPTVFISYAHESDALRASVAALGQWLVGHGCRVFTDHPYVDRPPPEGWLAWMLGCIEQADTVLVVCTPRLKGRYEKTAAPDAGRGATYEGAIVTQRIYDDVMRNTKFYPILPDGGSEDDIPTALKPAPQTATAMVQRFAECPAEQVQPLFYVVRRALLAVPPAGRDHAARHAAEEAAAALYCLAACRLVDEAARTARLGAPGADRYVMHVPSDEQVICGIIATAVFGGELRLLPAEQPGLPRPEYAFEVKLPAGGDQIAADFERAAFAAVFPNDREAPEISLDSGPLDTARQKQLAARFRTIRHVRGASLALVVHGLVRAEGIQGFAASHEVPVMLPATEATTALLGMDAGTLLAEIREFWAELQVLPRPASRPAPAHHHHHQRGTRAARRLRAPLRGAEPQPARR
ncbi:MAG: SEFIR domain-containing protein [Gammaproteobacteria bacterium]